MTTDPTCDTCKHFGPNRQGSGNCYITLPPQLRPLVLDSSVSCLDSCSLHAPIPETDRTSD